MFFFYYYFTKRRHDIIEEQSLRIIDKYLLFFLRLLYHRSLDITRFEFDIGYVRYPRDKRISPISNRTAFEIFLKQRADSFWNKVFYNKALVFSIF